MYKYNLSKTFSAASTRPAPACGRLDYKVIVSMRNLNYIEQKSVITARPFPLDGKTNSYNALLEASVRILYGRIHGATQLCRCVMMLLPQYYFLLRSWSSSTGAYGLYFEQVCVASMMRVRDLITPNSTAVLTLLEIR